MSHSMKELTDYLVGLGVEKIPHTQKSYLGHLINVHRLMKEQGCDEELCRAGLFHSIYGTERFQGFKLPLERRAELRQRIGERAERLAFLNCMMDRATIDAALEQTEGPYRIVNRETREEYLLTDAELDDLCRVHLYDWLEQVPRSALGWGYRRRALRRMAERLGSPARDCYDRVFAAEPNAATPVRPA